MRILGGTLTGRTLTSSRGAPKGVRPSQVRLRKSVFDILVHGVEGFSLQGARVIDAFAGSGALGFEALSRGAAWVMFVDSSRAAVRALEHNCERFQVRARCVVVRGTALDPPRAPPGPGATLFFADPPYGRGWGVCALQAFMGRGFLRHDVLAVLEEKVGCLEEIPPPFEVLTRRTQGRSEFVILRPQRRPKNRSTSLSDSSTYVGRP